MTTDAGSTAGGTEQGATGGVAAAPGERRARRHREIMDAAAAVFSEKGFHGASTRDIAERVGLRQGSLYYHFPSKEAALE
ncbi:MAG TPA: helix-turn-helix domain-containing protein, partial [Alphaproteobacteria bacterium]|nr:helix-turn-helix domain-containing protein [Alphaproteobacteria bacterium]